MGEKQNREAAQDGRTILSSFLVEVSADRTACGFSATLLWFSAFLSTKKVVYARRRRRKPGGVIVTAFSKLICWAMCHIFQKAKVTSKMMHNKGIHFLA